VYDLPENAEHIGHDEWVVKLTDGHGQWIGIDHYHPNRQRGGWCAGCAMFDLPAVRERYQPSTTWHVESFEPLTLSPSLLCRTCGRHGYIRGGAWDPA
jgi:hypothetical protein